MRSSEATAKYVSIALIGQSWGFEWRRIPKTLEAPSRKVLPKNMVEQKVIILRKTHNFCDFNTTQTRPSIGVEV